MKNTFISELADRILAEQSALDRVTVVFPNRRAGLFFRQALGAKITSPVWMPEVLSMEDFVLRHTPLQRMETLEAVFALYEVYKSYQRHDDTFDQFFFWGEMILRDFEEIDQYLVPPQQLFTSIKSQKELDEEFYFLDEQDREVIQSFWSRFLPKATKTQEAFLQTWKLLLPIYEAYQAMLLASGRAYGGLIYRRVCEQLAYEPAAVTGSIYFAGFNALTFAEEAIIKHYVQQQNAQVVWDLDAYYFHDGKQEAGRFFRSYAKDPVLEPSFPKAPPQRFKAPKKFTATGVSLEVGQTKALAEELEALTKVSDFRPEETVIVLPHEHMLFPTLHAIPDQIEKVNITMGYPLKDTPVFSLLESALSLQKHRRENLVNGVFFYYKPVLELLEHPLLFQLEHSPVKELIHKIRRQNLIYLYPEDFDFKSPIFKLLFRKPEHALTYLLAILEALHASWKEKGHDLELEFISRFHAEVHKLDELLGDRARELSYDFLIKLFRRLSKSLKIPFTGEPLNGLQVMGILETRNLDFKRVFILSMNEDSWPATPKRGSFVPYNIRRAFNLPVFEQQDAIYSYLFYRLLQRADEVHFYYNTVAEFNVNGELSRLVQQLEEESGYTIDRRILASPIRMAPIRPIVIPKEEMVLRKMDRFLDGYAGRDASRLTPSALNAYLDCSLRFYFKYVEKLYEPDEVQEEMDAMVFGNILHNTMELLYKQFMTKNKRDIIQPEDIFWIREGINGALNQVFIEHYGITNQAKFKLEGRSLIAGEVLKKFINKILDYDQAYAPFRILGLEATTRDGYSLEMPIITAGQFKKVRIKGVIDRIDLKGNRVRVIDYKTGRDEKIFRSLDSLTDRDDKKRNKAVFQVFLYSYLYLRKVVDTDMLIEPGLFNSRDLFTPQFEWRLTQKEDKESVTVQDFRRFADDFEKRLTDLLSELYDSGVPFSQTSDKEKCKYCPYSEICHRS